MAEKQQTLKQDVRLSGVGLHTGSKVTACLKPAPAGSGIRFVRTDLPGSPVIESALEHVMIDDTVPRCTSLQKGEAVIHTVEHLMSSLWGLGIDNVTVEIDGEELPGLDGSGLLYLKAIKEAGIVRLEQDREVVEIKEPLSVSSNGASILIVPAEGFQVSYTLAYRHDFLTAQFFSARLDGEAFEREIAPCRTFCLEEEANELRARGLGQGANYDNTLVVGARGVVNNTVRFQDEFARHKVLDLIGDLYLLGHPIRGQIFAVKSGHQLNVELLKKIALQHHRYKKHGFIPRCDFGECRELDIGKIMQILPHRYPFLLVDRVVELERGRKALGIKNVTINEQFFCGHFPTRPVMPGVLMIEAMAQVGGVIVLTNEDHQGQLALFMATDKVKFRRVVEPGDQLQMEVEVVRDRKRTAALKGTARVNGQVAAEAEMMFSFTDASYLD